MTTRWRWSPRWNTNRASCPTLSASSGVIKPLARPRIPSVPKYLRLIYPPAAIQGFFRPSGKKPRTPAIMACTGYNAFGAKMASKNMMNRYHRAIRRLALNLLLTQALCRQPDTGLTAASALSLDVKVAPRGRRLGDIDRIGSRKGLFQALLERFLQRAVHSSLLGVFRVLGVGAWCGHGCPPGRWPPFRGAIWRMAQPC